jgi:hypothetical protein
MNDTPPGGTFIHVPWPEIDAASIAGRMEEVARWFDSELEAGFLPDRASRWALFFVEQRDLVRAHQALAHVTDPDEGSAILSLLIAAEDEATAPDASPRESAAVSENSRDADGDEPDLLLDPPLPNPEEVSRDAIVIALFLRFFGGRRDIYARQWHDTRRKRGGYRPVREPLTDVVVAAHLEAHLTLGQYLLFSDDTVSFAVFDLDLAPDALARWRTECADVSAAGHPTLKRYARALTEAAARIGLPLFGEDSGGKGLHLWMFFEPRIPARAARAALSQVLLGAGSPPADVRVELFPKQERAGERGLSSLVKLPLGVHQATLRPCPLLDDHFDAIEDRREALSRLRAPAPDVLRDVLGHRLVPLPPLGGLPVDPPPEPLPAPSRHLHARSLGEALITIPHGRVAQEACDRMLAGCAILREIARRAYEKHALLPDEARAIVYTLGLVSRGKHVADEILAVAGSSSRELERVRRGTQAPTGCRRLRALWCDAPACPCPDGPEALPYATPALFVVGGVLPSAPDWQRFAPWIESGEAVVEDPLRTLGATLIRIDERLRRLEARSPDPLDDEQASSPPDDPHKA